MQKGHILVYLTQLCFVSARMVRDLPQNAGCCTGDEFLWLATFTEAYKCFAALGFMVCVLSKRVCQQPMQRIPGEQGKQLSSLAPSVQKAGILWGRELIAPSVALGLSEGGEVCLPCCLVHDVPNVKGSLSRQAGTQEQAGADSRWKFKVQFCCYCIGFIINLMIFSFVVAGVLVCVFWQTGISEVPCFQSELVLDTFFCLLVQYHLEQSKAFSVCRLLCKNACWCLHKLPWPNITSTYAKKS